MSTPAWLTPVSWIFVAFRQAGLILGFRTGDPMVRFLVARERKAVA
jgi:hypothetical protein